MLVQRPEAPAKRDLLVRFHRLLVNEEHHLVLVERGSDIGHVFIRNGTGEADSTDLGAKTWGEWGYLHLRESLMAPPPRGNPDLGWLLIGISDGTLAATGALFR